MDPSRRLIINADDFGLSEAVNRGILEAHEAGSVTSASLFVNLPAFHHALQCAERAPQLGVGLHFNLTAGPPVASPDRVHSLCDADTENLLPLRRLIGRALRGRVRAGEVVTECEAQIARLRAAGVTVTHLDSHRHVHLLPGIWKPVREAARRAGIGIVRLPLERLANALARPSALAEQLSLRAAYRLAGGNGNGRHVDHFRGSALFDRRDFREGLLELLDDLQPGLTELMVHPGYSDDEAASWDSYTWPRERELAALTDRKVRARLSAGDLTLTHFGVAAATRRSFPGPRPERRAVPHFSVVVPAYNEAQYLPRLLDSIEVARRVYSPDPAVVEVIVADNLSLDRTRELACERRCRTVTETKRVIAAVRNTGAAVARGGILVFVDADSQIHPETFTRISATLESSTIVGGATGLTMDRWSTGIAVSFAFLSLFCRVTGFDTGAVFCRRESFDAVGGFDERLLFAEDLAFYRALRGLARKRGQRFVRLRGIRTVTSTRKFEQFGDWGWPLANARIIWLAAVRSARARRLIEQHWYTVRT
jgi:predicted glycoside hydrolase/deacetylase ChbG (UPF0249 family)